MLNKYKKNIFSQNGEDGIILEIIKRLNLNGKNKWCCEFGAWNGIHGSNTFNLVKNFNFNAVYIEGDKKRFKDLIITKSKFSKIFPFNKYVSYKKNSLNSLDNILKKTKIKKNFEILSIDIDSYDLAVWKSLKKYRPEIVIIEINSGIPPGIKHVHSKNQQGNSFTSTVNYAKKNGYHLVCHTGNCIFIKKKYFKNIKIKKKYINNPEILFDKSWLNKKDSIAKRYIAKYMPKKMLDFLREIRR